MKSIVVSLLFYLILMVMIIILAFWADDVPSTATSEQNLSSVHPKISTEENDTIEEVETIMDKQSPQLSGINNNEARFVDANLNERLKSLGVKSGASIYLRLFKQESLLELWIKVHDEYQLLKSYGICAYSGELGPKQKEGDKQSPEGFYRVRRSALNPKSSYHLSFNLGYPNAYDQSHGRTGSFLMVHGECVSIGCYAMTNVRIEEIYALVEAALKHGQSTVPVHIFPFYMTDEKLLSMEESPWYDFWLELKEGYDYFESEGLPPSIKVENGHYTIHEANQ